MIPRSLRLLWIVCVVGSSAGCAPRVVLHPIAPTDIQAVKAGAAVTPVKDGWLLSDFYLQEVLQAKVEAQSP